MRERDEQEADRLRACLSKIRYLTFENAQVTMPGTKVYLCRFCGGFHVAFNGVRVQAPLLPLPPSRRVKAANREYRREQRKKRHQQHREK